MKLILIGIAIVLAVRLGGSFVTSAGIVNLTQQETKLATWVTGMHVSSSG